MLIAGLLMLGSFAISEGVSEEVSSVEHTDFSESNPFASSGVGDVTPCGEEGPTVEDQTFRVKAVLPKHIRSLCVLRS